MKKLATSQGLITGPGASRKSSNTSGTSRLAESHLTFHTWPEHEFAALDAFMCGECRPQVAIDWLSKVLRAQSRTVRVIERGAAPSSKDPAALG